MTAGSHKITIEQGSTFRLPMILKSSIPTGPIPVQVGHAVATVWNRGSADVWYGLTDQVTPATGTLVPAGGKAVVDPAADVWLASNVEAEARVPSDLTGYTARMQIRPKASSADVLLTLTTEDGGIVIDGPNGTLELFADDAATAALSFKTAVYDLEKPIMGTATATQTIRGIVGINGYWE